jgi:hypothetical protein
VRAYGTTNWQDIAVHLPGRNARQCRERWSNYINPNLLKTEWTESEDDILLRTYREIGPKWFMIASFLPGRSKNSVKNRYFTLQRRSGLDIEKRSVYPTPTPSIPASANENPKSVSDGIPELSEWPDLLVDEALFDWDFEPDQHGFFNYF